VLFIVFGVLSAFFALLAPLGLSRLAALVSRSGDQNAPVGAIVLGFAGIAIAVVKGVSAVLNLVTGWGLLNFKPWARIAGIVMAALNLIQFPLGTAFGVYALVILFRKETEALFAKQADRSASASTPA
jgi:hypothetical protein